MKTYITRNSNTETGFELKIVNNDGSEVFKSIKFSKPDKNGILWLVLPENPANRTYMALPKAQKIVDELELEYKETKVFGPRNGKKIEDYLTAEEKKIIEEIMDKAKARKEADVPKELTPIEKAQLEVEKAQKRLEKLLAEEAKA